jgi:hypothetical protein
MEEVPVQQMIPTRAGFEALVAQLVHALEQDGWQGRLGEVEVLGAYENGWACCFDLRPMPARARELAASVSLYCALLYPMMPVLRGRSGCPTCTDGP